MYKVSVPVMNGNLKRNGREETLREIKKFGAERIFLALDTYQLDSEKRRESMDELKDNCRFFKEQGYEVGAWIWTFWVKNNVRFRNMRGISGSEFKEYMCPTDESFVAFAADYIKEIAGCGVDMIMFDDDFRYGFLGDSPACLCDGHIDIINRMTDSSLTREEIKHHIVTGGKNKYRDAYLKANGDAFRAFASAVRHAVNSIDPAIRVGACACMSSWDVDGTDAAEISHILAGGTRPFVRLIGAPYWGAINGWGNSLQDVIELERMESVWTRDGDIEIMAEGDVYPRPRTSCPASFLEGFDTAIRASGCTDGILKYGIDYCSNAGYEQGYARFHQRNIELYSKIDRLFSSKTNCGVRVYESMKKISDAVTPTKVNGSIDTQDLFFSRAARTLAYNTIPTVYEGEGVCGIVFDENARNLPDEAFRKGLILDITAAEILTERGFDVGLESIGDTTSGECEYFLGSKNNILTNGAEVCDIRLKSAAEILSRTDTPKGAMPMSYRYENADGNRFLVLNIKTRSPRDKSLKNYERSRQYAEQIQWLSGERLPAYCYGNPALYIQCKKGDGALSVGLWNFYADTALEPEIALDRDYSQIEFINCTGRLEGGKVYLSDIPPYAFAGFEVR